MANKEEYIPKFEDTEDIPQFKDTEEYQAPTDMGEAALTGVEQFGSMGTMGLTDIASPALGATIEHGAELLGLGNEALAGKSWVERYREYRDAQKAQREEHLKAHPVAGLVGGAAGILSTGALMPAGAISKIPALAKAGRAAEAAMGASPKLAKAAELVKASKLATEAGEAAKGIELASQAAKLKRMGYVETALKNAAGASVYGATQSEGDLTKGEVGQVLKDAVETGAVGGALGLAMPAVGAATKGIIKNPMLLGTVVGGGIGLATGHPIAGLTMGLFSGYAAGSSRTQNAFKLAWKGVEDFSESALNTAKSPFVQKLNDTVTAIEEKFGIPAKEQIKTAFNNASSELAQATNKKGKEFYDMVYKMDDELESAYKTLDKDFQGGKMDPRPYFQKAKEIIESRASELSPAEKEELLSRVAGSEFKPSSEVLKKVASGEEGPITTLKGKGMTQDELAQKAVTIPKGAWEPTSATIKVSPGIEQAATTEMTKARVPGEAVTEMSPTQLRGFYRGFGEVGGAGEGPVSAVASDIASQLRSQFAQETNSVALNQKYNALREVLDRQLKVKLPNDPMRVNQQDLDKILNVIKDVVKNGDNQTSNVVMQELDKISPGLFNKWKTELAPMLKQETALQAGRGKDVLGQKAAMEAAGMPTAELAAPAKTVSDIERMSKEFGTPDAAHKYVAEIGTPLEAKNMARAAEVKEFTNSLRNYAPELVQELETKGLDLARLENVVALPKFHPTILATYKHAIEPVFMWGAKLAGKTLNTFMSMPEESLAKMPAMAKTIDLLKKTPDLQKAFTENAELRKVIFMAAQAKEDLPPSIGNWQASLFTAASRGLSALTARNFIIQQQDPDYRKALEEMNKD